MAKPRRFKSIVRDALDEKKMNQKCLAKELNISPQYVSHLMNGRSTPSSMRKYVPIIVSILDIDRSTLPDDIIVFL